MARQKGFIIMCCNILFVVFIFFAAIPSSASISHPEVAQDRRLLRSQNESRLLEDTVRVDPINHFKKYKGGYDIRNKHYWSSTAFTGVYGYAISLIWLVAGVVYGVFLLVRRFYFKHNKNLPCYKKCYNNKHAAFAVFLAILAIVVSGLVLCGSSHYHSRSRTILRIIINTEDDASSSIRNVTTAMDMISVNLASGYVVGRYRSVSRFLKAESLNLNRKADRIERQAQRNRQSIGNGLSIVFIITLVAVSLSLILVLALIVFGFLRFQRTIEMLIALCWILTILCWLLFGTYFFLENFSKDTCTAISDFQENPKGSSLSSILPCDRLASAKSVLHKVSAKIYKLVSKANANISSLRKSLYPELVYVCNPFSGPPHYLYQPEKCPSNTIKIGDIPQVLKLFTCSNNSTVSCKGVFISSSALYTIRAVTSSVQSLLDSYPVMQSLVECRLVKDSFSLILENECKPWKRDARMAWLAMLGLSVLMTTLIIVCVIRAHYQLELSGHAKWKTTQNKRIYEFYNKAKALCTSY